MIFRKPLLHLGFSFHWKKHYYNNQTLYSLCFYNFHANIQLDKLGTKFKEKIAIEIKARFPSNALTVSDGNKVNERPVFCYLIPPLYNRESLSISLLFMRLCFEHSKKGDVTEITYNKVLHRKRFCRALFWLMIT